MNPYLAICQRYLECPQEHEFGWYISWHLEHGFVFNTPEYFVMGRGANKRCLEQNGVELKPEPREFSDCWYVHAMAGDLNKAWDILPWYLPWIAFERSRGGVLELTIVKMERIRRLCSASTENSLHMDL